MMGKCRGETYHRPVELLQVRVAIKTVEDTRYETAGDEEDNPNVIELVTHSIYSWRVIRDSVVRPRHPQT